MVNSLRLISVILLLNTSVAMAGTIVTLKNGNDTSDIITDGKQVRMGMGDEGYVIVDHRTHSVKAVDPRKKQVMLMNVDDLPKSGRAPKVNVQIGNLGSGPTIAGYKTKKFSYKVNGKSCGIIYGSKDAYKLQGIKELFNAMQIMAQRQQAMMGGYAGMIDACILGTIKIGDHVSTVGVPMRMEENGKVDTEVLKIKLNAALSADTFSIPSSYKTISMTGEIKKAQKDMANIQQQMGQQMQQHQPQIQQMMQQMQQSGQMSPEMMEQLRKAQEQMRQYQQ